MAEEKKNAFEVLNAVNVNGHTEVKDTGKTKLTYLSWAWAWAEVKKRYPETSYEIIKFNGLPYVFDVKTGYMVYTTVTIEGITHEMWLPVMDGNNRAMLDHPYEVQTKYSKFTVQPATMFDINKTIMRCLTKNLAMFGLGLYIYAGEDLPEDPEEVRTEEQKPKKASNKAKKDPTPVSAPTPTPTPTAAPAPTPNPDIEKIKERYQEFIAICKENNLDIRQVASDCNLKKTSTLEDFDMAIIYARSLAETTEV